MNIEDILSKINAISADKVAHFASGVICFAIVLPALGVGYALLAVAVIAVAKEAYDYAHRNIHTPDVWDAVATTLGAAVGLFIARFA